MEGKWLHCHTACAPFGCCPGCRPAAHNLSLCLIIFHNLQITNLINGKVASDRVQRFMDVS